MYVIHFTYLYLMVQLPFIHIFFFNVTFFSETVYHVKSERAFFMYVPERAEDSEIFTYIFTDCVRGSIWNNRNPIVSLKNQYKNSLSYLHTVQIEYMTPYWQGI